MKKKIAYHRHIPASKPKHLFTFRKPVEYSYIRKHEPPIFYRFFQSREFNA